jgi:L-iditol 2-dehydrogenase
VDRIDRGDVAGAFGVDEFAWTTGERWAAGVAAGAAPEVVVEAVGHQVSTLRHALRAVAPGGTVFYFGVNDDPVYPLDMGLMLRKNLTLMSGGTLERPRMLAAAHDYLQRHPDLLRRSVTHRFTRPDVQRAYETAARPAPGQLKVVVSIAT